VFLQVEGIPLQVRRIPTSLLTATPHPPFPTPFFCFFLFFPSAPKVTCVLELSFSSSLLHTLFLVPPLRGVIHSRIFLLIGFNGFRPTRIVEIFVDRVLFYNATRTPYLPPSRDPDSRNGT